MKNNKSIIVPSLGMRIKIALLSSWCQVKSQSLFQWLKGKVIDIPNENTIVVNIKSKKVGKINKMMCFRDKKTGNFKRIIKCK